MERRSFAGGLLFGAVAVGAVWAVAVHGSGSGSAGTDQIRVLACGPHHTLSMTIGVSNAGSAPQAYKLTAYWFKPDGKQWLVKTLETDAVAPGKSTTVTAGNPTDQQDYRSGMTCQVKVVGAR